MTRSLLVGSTHIFLPISDGTKPNDSTHWSFLLVSVLDRRAFHYDTSQVAFNIVEAQLTTSSLCNLLGWQLEYQNITVRPPVHANDSGVLVCAMMHCMLSRLLQTNGPGRVQMDLTGRVIDVDGCRGDILGIIEDRAVQAGFQS